LSWQRRLKRSCDTSPVRGPSLEAGELPSAHRPPLLGKYDSSHLEALLAAQLRAVKAPPFVRELRFHPERQWRADFSWPDHKLMLEVMGGTHRGGAHTRHAGYQNDCEKMNEAVLLGWRVLWVTSDMVQDGRALAFIERALGLPTPPRRSFEFPRLAPGRGRKATRPRATRDSRLVLPR